MARSAAVRRAAVRADMVTERALALYDAANTGKGVGPTASALFRAGVAVSAAEADPPILALRSALGNA
jgi:hypothetical protein